MYDEVDLSYLAGVLDSDGCFMISKTKQKKTGYLQWHVAIQVRQCDNEFIDWAKYKFGGSVYLEKKRNMLWRDIWIWKVWSDTAVELSKLVQPYLKIKRAQAIIDFQSTKKDRDNWGTRGFTEGELAEREAIYQRLKQYNKRGPQHG